MRCKYHGWLSYPIKTKPIAGTRWVWLVTNAKSERLVAMNLREKNVMINISAVSYVFHKEINLLEFCPTKLWTISIRNCTAYPKLHGHIWIYRLSWFSQVGRCHLLYPGKNTTLFRKILECLMPDFYRGEQWPKSTEYFCKFPMKPEYKLSFWKIRNF